jgi:cytochrome c biogenesis protein CcmG/thiol:disulfide interchange protein DsbE
LSGEEIGSWVAPTDFLIANGISIATLLWYVVKLDGREPPILMRAKRLIQFVNDTPRWMSLVAAVFLLGVTWIWFSAEPGSAGTGDRIPSPREGFLAPDFTLEGQSGKSWTLSDLRGNVVMVNLWASWCPPCRAEMPALQQVFEHYQDQGVEILAINTTYQDREVDARAFIDEMNLSFPILFDRTGDVSRQYQLRAMPSTFFIDHEGVIQKVILGGPISEATFQTAVEELMRDVP